MSTAPRSSFALPDSNPWEIRHHLHGLINDDVSVSSGARNVLKTNQKRTEINENQKNSESVNRAWRNVPNGSHQI